MAGFFKNFLDSMKFSEEDDDYEAYLSEQEEKDNKRNERQIASEPVYKSRTGDIKAPVQEPVSNRNITTLEERRTKASQEKGKVVQFRNSSFREELGLYVSKPTAFSDCQDISDILVGGTAVVINLEDFDDELAQRIMDFISGAVYALNGKIHQISNLIFIVSPENVDISGDYLSYVEQNGFEVPTLNR